MTVENHKENVALFLIKSEILALVDQMTEENIDQTKNYLNQYFSFYEDYHKLPFTHVRESLLGKEVEKKPEEKEVLEDSQEDVITNTTETSILPIKDFQTKSNKELIESFDPRENVYIGQVKLLLVGAHVGSYELYLPEVSVKNLELKDGDWVKARKLPSYDHFSRNPKFDCELLQRSDTELPSARKTIESAIVQLEPVAKVLFIKARLEDELPTTIVLNDRIIGSKNINEGDVIDFTYSDKDYERGKISWQYRDEDRW